MLQNTIQSVLSDFSLKAGRTMFRIMAKSFQALPKDQRMRWPSSNEKADQDASIQTP